MTSLFYKIARLLNRISVFTSGNPMRVLRFYLRKNLYQRINKITKGAKK